MKKLFLIAALMFASFGAFADEFDDVVRALQGNSAGLKVSANRAQRVIYIDFNLPPDVTSATSDDLAEFKAEFIKSFRSSSRGNGPAVMKRVGASFCINLIMTNGRVLRVRITPDEL